MTDKEAMKQIIAEIYALPEGLEGYFSDTFADNLAKVREALAQSEQEPVAWVNKERNTITWDKLYPDMDALYTTPPQRTWVGLTDEEMHECAGEYPWTPTGLKCVRAIEAKLKQKNGYAEEKNT